MSQNTKKELVERRAADLKLKSSCSQWICRPTAVQRGANEQEE